MALTVEQTLLLNNLMYMDAGGDSPLQRPDGFEGQTVRDWINSIDTSRIDPERNYGSYMTGEDWCNIIQAVQQDDVLMNMEIAETHVDASSTGGDGRSAVFISEESGDAVVVFKGTESSKEWMDNFLGGNTTDTDHQKNALEWYQQAYEEYGLSQYDVTVTGHSKGGNKAKYITILDDTVDHCISFDGQGFSDQFFEKYADEIAARQSKVENHNVDYDYVNFLLNDLGESTFYQGQEYGSGGFLENHCANTFLKFAEDGSVSMVVNPEGQAEQIQMLDEFLNGLIRSVSDEQRADMLMMVNDIVNQAFSLGGSDGTQVVNTFLDMAADPKYADSLAYLLAYTIEYEQANPEFVENINQVLEAFGMGGAVQYVDMVDEILGFSKDIDLGILGTYTVDFDLIYDVINGAADVALNLIPDWIWDLLLKLVKDKTGVDLTQEELMHLLDVIGKTNQNMETIQLEEDVEDRAIKTAQTGQRSSACSISVQIPVMERQAQNLQDVSRSLRQYAENVRSEATHLSFESLSALMIFHRLCMVQKHLIQRADQTKNMSASLTEITHCYEKAENECMNQIDA